MKRIPRREYLALGGGMLAVGMAGCSDEQSEFLVTNTQIIHQRGDDRYEYPEDVLVRVAIENSYSSQQEGTLELTLTHDPDGEHVETWSKTDHIELSQGASLHPSYVFENVFEEENDIDDYSVEGEIRRD